MDPVPATVDIINAVEGLRLGVRDGDADGALGATVGLVVGLMLIRE